MSELYLQMHSNHNFTLDNRWTLLDANQDAFEGIFQDTTLKILTTVFYISGLFPCIGIAFVVWFEKSGKLGRYRTLVNRMASNHLAQVSKISCKSYDFLSKLSNSMHFR